MSLPKRIAAHAALTALALAVVGVMLSELAGTYLNAGSRGTDGGQLADTLRWRLPLTMAGWGVLFVVVGECLMAAWRPEKKPPPAKVDAMAAAEAEIQRILAEAERPRTTNAE